MAVTMHAKSDSAVLVEKVALLQPYVEFSLWTDGHRPGIWNSSALAPEAALISTALESQTSLDVAPVTQVLIPQGRVLRLKYDLDTLLRLIDIGRAAKAMRINPQELARSVGKRRNIRLSLSFHDILAFPGSDHKASIRTPPMVLGTK